MCDPSWFPMSHSCFCMCSPRPLPLPWRRSSPRFRFVGKVGVSKARVAAATANEGRLVAGRSDDDDDGRARGAYFSAAPLVVRAHRHPLLPGWTRPRLRHAPGRSVAPCWGAEVACQNHLPFSLPPDDLMIRGLGDGGGRAGVAAERLGWALPFPFHPRPDDARHTSHTAVSLPSSPAPTENCDFPCASLACPWGPPSGKSSKLRIRIICQVMRQAPFFVIQ